MNINQAVAHRLKPGMGGARSIAPALANESVQERSYRLWAEHYETVASAPDLSVFSLSDLERASNFASTMVARELRKGWDGDTNKVDQKLVAALQHEVECLKFELASRYAARDARSYASQANHKGVA